MSNQIEEEKDERSRIRFLLFHVFSWAEDKKSWLCRLALHLFLHEANGREERIDKERKSWWGKEGWKRRSRYKDLCVSGKGVKQMATLREDEQVNLILLVWYPKTQRIQWRRHRSRPAFWPKTMQTNTRRNQMESAPNKPHRIKSDRTIIGQLKTFPSRDLHSRSQRRWSSLFKLDP